MIDVHPAAYIAKFGNVCARLAIKSRIGELRRVVQLEVTTELGYPRPRTGDQVALLPGMSEAILVWKLPESSNLRCQDHWLGCYEVLFDKQSDLPFPSWDAVMWLGSDHKEINRAPIVALDKLDFMERASRVSKPPQIHVFATVSAPIYERRMPS